MLSGHSRKRKSQTTEFWRLPAASRRQVLRRIFDAFMGGLYGLPCLSLFLLVLLI